MSESISVIGAGAWGTTLAVLLAEKGHRVKLWVYEKDLREEILELRENKKYLSGFEIPPTIEIISDPQETKDSKVLTFVVPSQHFRSIVKKFLHIPGKETILLSAAKGLEEKTALSMSQILSQELPEKFHQNIAVLSGPNLAKEIAKGLPAAAVIASKSLDTAKYLQNMFMSERFRIYIHEDIIGVELGGALKNIIALAAGIADGLGLGDNAKAALMVRGMVEITRLGVAMGADLSTFAGLSGIGDLIVTCSSRLSRNHYVGEEMAKGAELKDILAHMAEVAEGVPTTRVAYRLAKKYRVEMPITAQVYAVLFEKKDPYKAITDLMAREAKLEV